MDDINQKLSEILNDEESMKKVRSLAESLLSGEEKEEKADDGLGFSPSDLNKIMNVLKKVKSDKTDNRTALLYALKPNLSERKQQKVDTAIKLLKLIELLPYLKESGILNIF